MSAPDTPNNNVGQKWNRPLNELNLKIWVPKSENNYRDPSIGIGLGTKKKPDIFSFATLNNESIQWFQDTLKTSTKILRKYSQNKSSFDSDDNPILWLKRRDVNKLKNIYISLFVLKGFDNISVRLMLNSRSSLSEELNLKDINWIIETLNIAKYTINEGHQNE